MYPPLFFTLMGSSKQTGSFSLHQLPVLSFFIPPTCTYYSEWAAIMPHVTLNVTRRTQMAGRHSRIRHHSPQTPSVTFGFLLCPPIATWHLTTPRFHHAAQYGSVCHSPVRNCRMSRARPALCFIL